MGKNKHENLELWLCDGLIIIIIIIISNNNNNKSKSKGKNKNNNKSNHNRNNNKSKNNHNHNNNNNNTTTTTNNNNNSNNNNNTTNNHNPQPQPQPQHNPPKKRYQTTDSPTAPRPPGRWRCGRRPDGGAVAEYGGAGEESGGAVVHDARRPVFLVGWIFFQQNNDGVSEGTRRVDLFFCVLMVVKMFGLGVAMF